MKNNIKSYLPALALALVVITATFRPAKAQPNRTTPIPLAAVLYATDNGQGLFVYLFSVSPGCPTIEQGESLAGAMAKLKGAGLQLKSSSNWTFTYEN